MQSGHPLGACWHLLQPSWRPVEDDGCCCCCCCCCCCRCCCRCCCCFWDLSTRTVSTIPAVGLVGKDRSRNCWRRVLVGLGGGCRFGLCPRARASCAATYSSFSSKVRWASSLCKQSKQMHDARCVCIHRIKVSESVWVGVRVGGCACGCVRVCVCLGVSELPPVLPCDSCRAKRSGW